MMTTFSLRLCCRLELEQQNQDCGDWTTAHVHKSCIHLSDLFLQEKYRSQCDYSSVIYFKFQKWKKLLVATCLEYVVTSTFGFNVRTRNS